MKKMTEEEKRDMIAEIVGRRLGIRKQAVKDWMDKHQIYDLGEIIKQTKDFDKFLTSILEVVKI